MSEDQDLLNELEEMLTDEDVSSTTERATKKNETPSKVETESGVSHEELEPGEILIVNPIEKDGDLQQLLQFDDLDLALKEQAGLYTYYSAATARAQLQYNRAKQNVEQVEAKANYVIRQECAKTGEKFTEKTIDSRVRMTRMYRNALACQNDAQYIHKLCLSLVEGFQQREQMIIQTCKREDVERTVSSSYTSREVRDQRIKEALRTK